MSRRAVLGVAVGSCLALGLSADQSERSTFTYRSQFADFFQPGSVGDDSTDSLLNSQILTAQRNYFRRNDAALHDVYQTTRRVVTINDDRRFVASVIHGETGDAVVSGAEYGNPLNRLGLVRHLGVRALVNPGAGSVYLPSNIRGQNNLNFSSDERAMMAGGDASPYVRRIEAALDAAGADGTIDAYGVSQSASLMPLWAEQTDRSVGSLAVIESPQLDAMSKLEAMARFGLSGSKLEQYQQMSALGITSDTMQNENQFTMSDFLLGALFDDDNQALLATMRRTNGSETLTRLRQLRPAMGMVAVWGSRSLVSSPQRNRQLAERLHDDHTQFFEAGGHGHVMTNAYAVVAAASLRARSLATA